MKLLISKNDNDIVTKISQENGDIHDFTNLELIDYLYYSEDKTVEFEFEESVSNEELDPQSSLEVMELFDEIHKTIVNDCECTQDAN